MKNDLKIPPIVTGIQVVLSALTGAFVRMYLERADSNWLIQLLGFIIAFVIMFTITGLIYLKFKK